MKKVGTKESKKIDYRKIDKKWQNAWAKAKAFEANVDPKRKKFFVNIPYPYVNGAPHIGAGFTFIRGDVYARFKRMQGFNVLFPQGFHATGEPIVGAVKRLREGDKSQIETFKIYGISDKDIKDFAEKGPEYVAKFWKKRWIEDLQATGFSIDWRRTFITTTMTPTYSRFVEWQYNTLKKKDYVVQGTHPVVWCPNCQSPTGDHDRLEGVGESPIEYIVIKFRLNSGEILPCATLRPETVYGVTNIWINPVAEYVHADVNGEKWIVSKSAVKKLEDQLKKVKTLGTVRGSELIGKLCENPVTKTKIPLLPAELCDVNIATGIVMSVPSHAPYDWIGLVDLKADKEQLKKYNIETVVQAVEPISIIAVEGFGDYPAGELCEKMGARNQEDIEKLDKATEVLYKKEFHTGVCKQNCGPYAGIKVSDAKQVLIKNLTQQKILDWMWETTAPVICRCKTRCHIKILENQWFLKFSDPQWKERAHECIKQMKFYPEEVRQQFDNTVDWLEDKACTRRSGLGTPLPWDKSWIVETLSDSVIYMAYYTIARVINERKIEAVQLTDEVFDYIFLNKGDANKIAKSSGLKKETVKDIEEMKKEFEYFYPFDLRNSGKDLVQNHLTYAIFHHVALWDKERGWPHAYGINGYVNVGGEKMSKSKGNFIPLRDLVNKHGADLVRINIVASNENMDDADWREESVQTYDSRLNYLFELASKLKAVKGTSVKTMDKYLQSKLHESIQLATDHYEHMRFRSAVQYSLFALTNEIKWYIERVGGIKNCNRKLLAETFEALVKMIAPLTPHFAEELWSKLGKKSLLVVEKWPEPEDAKIDKHALEMEEIYKKTIEDIKQVVKLATEKSGKEPKKLYLYFATEKEYEYFKESAEQLGKLGFKQVGMFKSNEPKIYDPQGKAKRAKYGKPGIFLE